MICAECGNTFTPKENRQRLCSRQCGAKRATRAAAAKASLRSSWPSILRNGYRTLWVRGRGYVYEHRLVMEQKLGRRLHRGEVVHHLNHDRLDNREENLELYASISEHMRGHGWPKGRPRPRAQKPQKPCPVCGTLFKPKRRDRADTKTCSQSCGQTLRQIKASYNDD